VKLFSFPLRFSIPVILLLMGCIAGGFSYQRQVYLAHERAEEELTQRAKLMAASTAQLLEYLYRRTDIQNSQTEGITLVVSRLVGDRNLNIVLFCDEQNRIRNASHYYLVNQDIAKTSFSPLLDTLKQVRRNRAGEIEVAPDSHFIRAIYPVVLPPRKGELRSNNVGALILEYNLVQYEQRAIADASQQSLQIIGMLSILCILVGVLLTRIVTQRAGRLVFASNQLAQGELDRRADLEGADELAEIANAFNQMATQIQHNTEALQQSKQQLKAQTEQLETTLQELHQTQAQLVQQEKMSSLGQLVAGVAHEINNPVNFIHGNLTYIQNHTHDLLRLIQLYQHHYQDPVPQIKTELETTDLEFLQTDLLKILNSMHTGTNRIRQIVLSLRNFSRIDEADFKAVDIHDGLESTLLILHHRLKARLGRSEIKIIRDYNKLSSIECYAGQLNQVFMNILANAIDALDEMGSASDAFLEQPALGTNGHSTVPTITIRTSVLNAEWVQIAIADNGTGIPKHIQSRIFDPFFTTKPIGKGTGMGMSISYQIITEKHGGYLKCLSTPGQGSEFIIQIPIYQQPHNAT